MRYSFHGHESKLDLDELLAVAPDLCERVRRSQGEEHAEDAVAFVLDVFGAEHVHQQRAKLEVILERWAYLAPRARSSNDQERVRAIPERLAWRFQTVWPDGRVALHLMLRAVMHRTGCNMHWAPLCVEAGDVAMLLDALLDGLRAGYASSVDTQMAIELLERDAAARSDVPTPASSEWTATDWIEVSLTDPGM
jgi:hypothetical protein